MGSLDEAKTALIAASEKVNLTGQAALSFVERDLTDAIGLLHQAGQAPADRFGPEIASLIEGQKELAATAARIANDLSSYASTLGQV